MSRSLAILNGLFRRTERVADDIWPLFFVSFCLVDFKLEETTEEAEREGPFEKEWDVRVV